MSEKRVALNIITAVFNDGAYLNLALKDIPASLDTYAVRRITALLYTTAEHARYIDLCIDAFAGGKLNRYIKNILRMGIAELLYMNTPAYAVCNEYVKLTEEIGKRAVKGYVNAVLRTVSRAVCDNTLPDITELPIETRLSVEYCVPLSYAGECVSRFGEEKAIAMLSYRDEYVSFRVQPPYTGEEFSKYLDAQHIEYTRGRLADVYKVRRGQDFSAGFENNPLFRDGKITIQSESSAFVCELMNVSPSDTVLDACAAPGGKSANLAPRCKHVDSWELHEHRAKLISNTLERLHVSNAAVDARDATEFDASFVNKYDAVLLDVPCSGLGVCGKPDIRLRISDSDFSKLAYTQAKILNTCCEYVKPGGILVYSTCTISERENAGVTNAFLAEHKDFSPAKDECLTDGAMIVMPQDARTSGFYVKKMVRS